MSVLPPGFDFASQTGITPTFQRTQYGKTYEYDFTTEEFVLDLDGHVVVLDGTNALKQCIEKIWRTERYLFLIYDGNYGADVIATIRAGNTDAALLLTDLNRVVVEGAMSDPRSVLVTDIEFTLDDAHNPTTVEIQCNLLDIFGVTTALDVTLVVT